MLTAAQITFFQTFGYLHVPGYFADEIRWISDEFNAVWSRNPEVVHDGSKRTIFPGFFIAQNPRLVALIEHPKVVAVCTALLGEGYGIQGGDGNFYSGDTEWHSDVGGEHWRWKTITRHLKIAFYLDPLTRDTGALRVIPGSHHHGDAYATALEAEIPVWNESRVMKIAGRDVPAVAIDSTPGDLVCFDHRLKHASFGGGSHRRMFTTNWMQGPHTPAMHEAILANFRQYRDDEHVDWRLRGEWFDHPPAEREPMLRLLKHYGPLVMAEVETPVAPPAPVDSAGLQAAQR